MVSILWKISSHLTFFACLTHYECVQILQWIFESSKLLEKYLNGAGIKTWLTDITRDRNAALKRFFWTFIHYRALCVQKFSRPRTPKRIWFTNPLLIHISLAVSTQPQNYPAFSTQYKLNSAFLIKFWWCLLATNTATSAAMGFVFVHHE